MRRRTFEEMITYFNQTVSEMDIDRKYKITLLGIVTALLQKHDEEFAKNSPKVNSDSDELISRQAAIDVLARMMPRSYTPDGSHPADEEIYKAQEIYADCIESIEILPAVQPEIIRCKDCDWWTKQKDSVQGRCELMQMYPAGGWYCGNARRRGGDSD